MDNLLELYRQFEELKHSTKKQEKIDCLNKYKDDKLFCFVLEFLLNTDKKTGLSTAKLEKEFADKEGIEFLDLNELKEELNIEW